MTIDNLTPAMERVLKMAQIEAEKDRAYLGANHILIAMLLEGKNCGSTFLKNTTLTVEELRGHLAK